MGSPHSQTRRRNTRIQTSPKVNGLKHSSRCDSMQSLQSSCSAAPKSRSLTAASAASTSSTTSMSGRFVSCDDSNNIIYIQPSNNPTDLDTNSDAIGSTDETWTMRIIRKYAMDVDDDVGEPIAAPIVFGLCESSLLAEGYRHKYYTYGYAVTYCHGFRFCSYATTFNADSDVVIRFQREHQVLSFWSDKGQEPRTMTIPRFPPREYALTIKSYDDQFAIEISKSTPREMRC